jgi:hypothetical protein
MSFASVGPTELRIILAVGAIKVAINPWVEIAGEPFRLFDVGGVIAIAGLLLAFVVGAVRNGVALYKAEPLPTLRPTERGRPKADSVNLLIERT